jgi:Fur family peroxide stress response transcriptional regulator
MIESAVHRHLIDIEALCHQHGIPCTSQRKLVWEYFAEQTRGHTVTEAVRALAVLGIGRATIYRTVELFEHIGILTGLRDTAGKQRYAAVCPGHAHTLTCRSCHQVVEFHDCGLTVLERLLIAKTGFTIEGHRLEIYGTCPACANS